MHMADNGTDLKVELLSLGVVPSIRLTASSAAKCFAFFFLEPSNAKF